MAHDAYKNDIKFELTGYNNNVPQYEMYCSPEWKSWQCIGVVVFLFRILKLCQDELITIKRIADYIRATFILNL